MEFGLYEANAFPTLFMQWNRDILCKNNNGDGGCMILVSLHGPLVAPFFF